ncbi:MAG: nucleotide exchange factor GrpE [Phycisphaerae bacterium]|nr:nucleotide exchange factor GrpE [Phycisphaerae bacterium]
MLKRKEDIKKQQLDAKEPAPDESASQAKAKISHKKKDLLAKLQRVTADFANYQKRMARNAAEARQWARAEMIKSILPAIDDFEQALEAGKTAQDVQSLLEGFELVHDHLLAMLGKQQVATIATQGQKFDPAVHEAMLHQESAEHEPGTVIAELRKGYTMNGRTLRPARVTVSKSLTSEAANQNDQNQDSEQ